jgi:hypothetical protein
MPYNVSSGMQPELLMLRQIFSQLVPNYAQVAILVGLLLVVIYRPERIRLLGMFRFSCVMLALSIVVPPAVSATLSFLVSIGGSSRSSSSAGDYMILVNLLGTIEPALVAASLCLGIFSLLPARRSADRTGPARHPLDSQPEE